MALPRQKECPVLRCGRKWASKPSTHSKCPDRDCGKVLVDLRTGDEADRVEHIECGQQRKFCPKDFVVHVPAGESLDWSSAWCPECGEKCAECGKRMRNPVAWRRDGCKRPECENKTYLDATGDGKNGDWVGTGHFEWLSYGWWRDPYTVVDKVYATTARKELVHELEREVGGPYTNHCEPLVECKRCGESAHLLVNGECATCRPRKESWESVSKKFTHRDFAGKLVGSAHDYPGSAHWQIHLQDVVNEHTGWESEDGGPARTSVTHVLVYLDKTAWWQDVETFYRFADTVQWSRLRAFKASSPVAPSVVVTRLDAEG